MPPKGYMVAKQNVLFLVGSFHQGGSERQAVQLARLLHENGRYRVHMACLDRNGVLRDEADRLGLGDIPDFPLTSFYDRNTAVQLRRFAGHLREREIDVVHTHDFYTNVFGMAGARLARVPVRVASRREIGGIRTGAQIFVERRAYALAHAVVANCEAVRQQLIKEGVRAEKIMTIYNGLDMSRVTVGPGLTRDEALARLNLPRDGGRRFVTIVANMRFPVKDHPTFLGAAHRVRAMMPGAAFIISGEGELTEQMRALATQLGLERDVFFIGRCDDVATLLAVSDVCVLSSKAEGFSNSILEYMAARRPVVATDVGGAREAIVEGVTGHLVPAGDDEKMAARIISLLGDPERARAMGERGRQIIEQKFSCRSQLERVEGLYDRLLATRPGRARQTGPRQSESVTGARARGEDGSNPARNDTEAPVRVLIVAPSTDILGGQAVQAARLLARLGQETTLEVSFLPVNPRLPGPLRRLQMIKYVRTVVTSLLYCALLLARVRKYDVIHIFSASYLSFVLAPTPAILVSKLFGKKIVLNYRSGQAGDHLRRWRRTAIATIRLVDEVVVPSDYLVGVFARYGLHAQAIFNFVESDLFRFRKRRPLRPFFLSNRNLEPLYNVGCVLRAFALIRERFPEARLTVAGDGSQRGELEGLARSLGLRNAEFVGRVAPKNMPGLYDSADIFLNSPEIDNMPGSIIESFASGLPVITTDAGGIPYIVTNGETGLLVRRGDHETMAACAVRLLEDDTLTSKIISKAREEVGKYSWASVRGEWLRLYFELARDKASPHKEAAREGWGAGEGTLDG